LHQGCGPLGSDSPRPYLEDGHEHHQHDRSRSPVQRVPTVSTNGDNGAITIATGAAGYLGQVDVVINQAFTDGAAGQLVTEINFTALTLYGLLEARGAWTPASAEVITVTLECAED
jgi:hypothetical protein